MSPIMRNSSLAFVFAALGAVSQAATINVPANFANVQSAIDAAASGDTVSINAAGTYTSNSPVPTKSDNTFHIVGGKSVTISASVSGVVFGSAVRVEQTSTATLTNLTIDGTGGSFSKGIVLNDLDSPYPSDFSALVLNNVTVQNCSENNIRMNGSNVITLNNSSCLNSTDRNITADGNANQCQVFLNSATVSGSVNSNGLGLHRKTNVTATGSTVISGNKGFGIFVDSFDDNVDGRPQFNLTGASVTGNKDRAMFLARACTGTFTNCTFSGPAASNDLFLLQYGNRPYDFTFTSCTINQSAGNGLAIVAISNGGATNGSSYTFNQCVLSGGPSGLAHFDNEADTPGVFNTLIANRSAFHGIANSDPLNLVANLDLEDTKATLTNCVIDGSATTGVLVRTGNDVQLRHVTLATPAGVSAAGVDVRDLENRPVVNGVTAPATTVQNSIISGFKVGVSSSVPNGVVVTNTLVNATTAYAGTASAGSSSITGSPNFVLAPTGSNTPDYHLNNGSPAISLAGSGQTTDYAGGTRPLPAGSRPDAGAFENATGSAVTAVEAWSLYL